MFLNKYIIRFDDISPYMNWKIWDQIEEILDKYDIKPIVAIVPNCKDKDIMIDDYNTDFWHRLNGWEKKGWSIALHGYTHVFESTDSGIIGINNYSEFAGISEEKQEEKIQNALEVFDQNHARRPKLWVAPAHSFDQNTLNILKKHGINNVSDSFSLYPYVDNNIFWIPQQIWSFKKTYFGIWTVCLHHNRWEQNNIDIFEKNILKYRNKISNLEFISSHFISRKRSILDFIVSCIINKIIIIKKKRRKHKNSFSNK